jgi:hypothetical protein
VIGKWERLGQAGGRDGHESGTMSRIFCGARGDLTTCLA